MKPSSQRACRYENLTREERIKRIGKIFAKGAFLLIERERAEEAARKREEEGRHSAPEKNETRTRREKICHYLARVGSAAPKDIQSLLGVSKATAFRLIRRLEDEDRIVKTGSTHAVRVELSSGKSLR